MENSGPTCIEADKTNKFKKEQGKKEEEIIVNKTTTCSNYYYGKTTNITCMKSSTGRTNNCSKNVNAKISIKKPKGADKQVLTNCNKKKQ